MQRRISLPTPAFLVLCITVVLGPTLLPPHTAHAAARRQAALPGLSVSGNHLLAGGVPITLHGVNRSGSEYACIQGWGFDDGPMDQPSVDAIAAWGANMVRIPLNEDCWLGINGVNPAYGGSAYIAAIRSLVSEVTAAGMYAELSLMWAAPGSIAATYQPGAPDEDHSPAMWASLASTFAGNPDVILAPWGETIVDADCFLNGGTCEATIGPNNTAYATAGMQQAVSVMRQAGYHGIISIPGINYANDLTQWLSHEPSDPDHQLIAEAHIYGNNSCGAQNNGSCLVSTLDPVAARVPLLLGETGETYDDSECSGANVQIILNWADSEHVSWAAWAWNNWGDCLSLIQDYSGTVHSGDAYAAVVHAHMLSYGSPSTPAGTSPSGQPTTTPVQPTPPLVPPSPKATPVIPTTEPPTTTEPAAPTHLAFVQGRSTAFDTANTGPRSISFAHEVTSGDLLVATIAIVGGNTLSINSVTDGLGNSWRLAAEGVNDDNTLQAIYYASAGTSGADTLNVAWSFAPGDPSTFAQTLLSVSEYHGAGVLQGAIASASSGLSHSSGSVSAVASDLVVSAYSDAGYGVFNVTPSNEYQLGTNVDNTQNAEGNQAYGYVASGQTGTSATYTTPDGAITEVALAVFS